MTGTDITPFPSTECSHRICVAWPMGREHHGNSTPTISASGRWRCRVFSGVACCAGTSVPDAARAVRRCPVFLPEGTAALQRNLQFKHQKQTSTHLIICAATSYFSRSRDVVYKQISGVLTRGDYCQRVRIPKTLPIQNGVLHHAQDRWFGSRCGCRTDRNRPCSC